MTETAAKSGMALSRVNLRETLTMPEFGDAFVGNLVRLQQTPMDQAAAIEAEATSQVMAAYGFGPVADDKPSKPFIFNDGVAVIAVHGTLLNRFPYSFGFVTGYQSIRRQINAIKADKAANPDDVQLVVFDHDSYGGEAAGCFELGAEIAALDEIVPTIAIIDSACCSASYALAVPCRKVYAIPSATVGSIGVYRLHISLAGLYSNAGIKFTFIKSGEHKTDGNPYEDLPPGVEADWQEKVDAQRAIFAEYVAEHTGLTVAQVLVTEASVYRAPEALDINLISGVLTPSEAVSTFLAELADDELDPEDDGDDEMKTGQEASSGAGGAASVPAAPAIDQAAIATAVSQGIAAHMSAQRARAATIRTSDAATANPALANHLIDNTEMTADEAIATLKAAGPAAKADTPKPEGEQQQQQQQQGGGVDTTNHLDAAMGGVKGPNISGGGSGGEQGAGGEQQRQAPSDKDVAGGLIADYALVTGRKVETK